MDVAFEIAEPLQFPQLIIEPLTHEPLLILAYPDHPLAASPTVHFTDLQGETLILTERTCHYRRMFLQALKTAHVQPDTLMEFHSVAAIKQSVMVGLGLTLLPLMSVENEIAQGKLVPLKWVGRDFQAVTQMLWHKDKWLSPTLQTFLNVAREILTEEKAAVSH